EEGALAEAQNAADPPDEGEAEREDRQHHIECELHNLERIRIKRQPEHQNEANQHRSRSGEQIGALHHMLLLKNLPVMPLGKMRSRTTATKSKATSPTTGVVANVVSWLTLPRRPAAEMVPVIIAGPPAITVIKACATKATPMVGTTPVIGAKSAPASPVSAEPIPNVAI